MKTPKPDLLDAKIEEGFKSSEYRSGFNSATKQIAYFKKHYPRGYLLFMEGKMHFTGIDPLIKDYIKAQGLGHLKILSIGYSNVGNLSDHSVCLELSEGFELEVGLFCEKTDGKNELSIVVNLTLDKYPWTGQFEGTVADLVSWIEEDDMSVFLNSSKQFDRVSQEERTRVAQILRDALKAKP